MLNLFKSIHKHLVFHINKHSEQAGDQVYKNLFHLFTSDNNKYNVTLVEHEWLEHNDFLNLISKMNIGLQVSYSESYNIVAADFISMNVPIVTSNEIKLVTPLSYANPNSISSIKKSLKLNYILSEFKLQILNKITLFFNNLLAKKIWQKFFKNF